MTSAQEIRVGDPMYRVIDDVNPGDDVEDGQSIGWMIQVRTVKAATGKTFRLDKPFSFCSQSHGRLSHGVVGRIMFTSEAGAIGDFLDKATRARDRARGQLAEAERMVTWADRWTERRRATIAAPSPPTERQDIRDIFKDAWLAGCRHCDDYIDDDSAHPALRAFLARARSPAHGMTSAEPFPVLFADHRGRRVRVVMASRLGDVGVVGTLDLASEGFLAHEERVAVEELSNFGVAP